MIKLKPIRKSSTRGAKEAGIDFYKSSITKKVTWTNSFSWFAEGFQEGLIVGTKLHLRIMAVYDKIKAIEDLSVFDDSFGSDTKVSTGEFFYELYPLKVVEITGIVDPFKFGGVEDYEYIKMTTQSFDFYVVMKRNFYKHLKKKKLCSSDFIIKKFNRSAKFDPSLLLATYNHSGVEKVADFKYTAFNKRLVVDSGAFVSWQLFCWWMNYFEGLEYQLKNPDL